MTKRGQQILDYLSQNGELSIQELSDLSGVSEISIRRDLVALNSNRFIERTRGGARIATVVNPENSLIYRLPVDIKEALTISYRAAQLVKPGTVIGISGGRLCTQLALDLRHRANLTVVTNAVNIAVELAGLQEIQVWVTSGQLNSGSFEMVGPSVSNSLIGLHIDQLFLGVDGVSLEYGITAHNEPEAAAEAAFMKISDSVIVLADSIKFKKVSFAQVAPISAIHTIVTTERSPREILKKIQEAGTQIIIA
jgi:DeoR family transcriptional regulator of aga operon